MGFSSSFSPPAAVAARCRCLSAGLLLLRAWRQAFASASVALVQGIQSSAKSGEFSKPGEFTNSPESGEFRSLVRKSLGYRGIGLILPGWAFSAQSLPLHSSKECCRRLRRGQWGILPHPASAGGVSPSLFALPQQKHTSIIYLLFILYYFIPVVHKG